MSGTAGSGTVTISIGGGNANNAGRVAIEWEGTNGVADPTDSNELWHRITLINDVTGVSATQDIGVGGGSTTFTSLADGAYTVLVSGWLSAVNDTSDPENQLKSAGRSPVQVTNGSGETTVTMLHAAQPVVVRFYPNTGSNTPIEQYVTRQTDPIPPFVENSGYTLDGWLWDEDMSGTIEAAEREWDFTTDLPTESTWLLAKWTPIITTITLTAPETTVPQSRTLQFTPAINYADGTTVECTTSTDLMLFTWTDDYPGDDVSINNVGILTVQPVVPVGAPIVVTATLNADPTKTASATVTVTVIEPTEARLYRKNTAASQDWIQTSVAVDANFVTNALTYINGNQGGLEYLMIVGADATVGALDTLTGAGTSLIIRADGDPVTARTITLSGTGNLFKVEAGAELTLDSGITLTGPAGNNDNALVIVTGEDSTLIMKAGSKITGNTNTSITGFGGGVHVENYGIFTMEGGEISGNKASRGGGVYVDVLGTFTMENGSISNNNADNLGGGVYVIGGSFTKTGPGEMTGNTADAEGDTVFKDMDVRWRNMDAADGDVIDTTKSDPAESGLPSD